MKKTGLLIGFVLVLSAFASAQAAASIQGSDVVYNGAISKAQLDEIAKKRGAARATLDMLSRITLPDKITPALCRFKVPARTDEGGVFAPWEPYRETCVPDSLIAKVNEGSPPDKQLNRGVECLGKSAGERVTYLLFGEACETVCTFDPFRGLMPKVSSCQPSDELAKRVFFVGDDPAGTLKSSKLFPGLRFLVPCEDNPHPKNGIAFCNQRSTFEKWLPSFLGGKTEDVLFEATYVGDVYALPDGKLIYRSNADFASLCSDEARRSGRCRFLGTEYTFLGQSLGGEPFTVLSEPFSYAPAGAPGVEVCPTRVGSTCIRLFWDGDKRHLLLAMFEEGTNFSSAHLLWLHGGTRRIFVDLPTSLN